MKTVGWQEFQLVEPEMAGQVVVTLGKNPHHILATIRKDGSPRVSGTNVFISHGELWIGSMKQAQRVNDLRREARCAIHSAPLDENLQIPDLRIDLVAMDASEEFARQVLTENGSPLDACVSLMKIRGISMVTVKDDHLCLDRWNPDDGRHLTRIK